MPTPLFRDREPLRLPLMAHNSREHSAKAENTGCDECVSLTISSLFLAFTQFVKYHVWITSPDYDDLELALDDYYLHL